MRWAAAKWPDDRLAVAGDSAGGALAAGCALAAFLLYVLVQVPAFEVLILAGVVGAVLPLARADEAAS